MNKKFNIKEWKDAQETPNRIDEYTSNNFTNLEANGWDIKQAFEYMEDNPLAKENLKSVTNLKNSTLKKVNALIKYLLKAGESKKTEGAIQESVNEAKEQTVAKGKWEIVKVPKGSNNSTRFSDRYYLLLGGQHVGGSVTADGSFSPPSDGNSSEDYVMKILKKAKIVESVNEAKLSAIHKAAKKGSYPVSIVVINSGMVVKQELVKTPAAVPAVFNELKKQYPNAVISVESRTGAILFSESVKLTK